MKTITTAMDTHLAGAVTTLATAWLITREDGVTRGFTDHDRDVTIDNQIYYASSGYFRTAISNSAGPSVDNVDVRGFLDSSHIDETELRNGKYDYATVQIFSYNWADTSMGVIPLRYGIFGETVITSSGVFKVELRGLTQLYSQTVGEVYQPECRADLGDERCKITLTPDVRKANTAYAVGDRVMIPTTEAFNYDLAMSNMDFENGTTGWSSFFDSSVAHFWDISPYEGTSMLRVYAGDGSASGSTYDYDLPTLPISQTDIDTGNYNIEIRARVNTPHIGAKAAVAVNMYSSTGTSGLLGTITTGDTILSRVGEWVEFVASDQLLPTTKSIQISLSMRNDTYLSTMTALFDAVEVRIYDPTGTLTTSTTFLNYDGVEYECTVAGTTDANAQPNPLSRTLADTVADGTVTWTVVEPTYTFLDTIATVTDGSTFTLTNNTKADGFFNWGVIEILDGNNQGRKIEVHTWLNATKQIVTKLPFAYVPQVGERVRLQAGCSKTREICYSSFNNILNFRGEPDLPGTDQYFKVGGANTQGEI